MRLLLVIGLLLTGCKSALPPLPVQPAGPTTPSVVTTLGKDLDRADHRVGAALVAIERNADKPKVVVAESRLAQSYLPAPPENDIAFAMARATKQDPIDYAKQMEFGRKLATAVNRAWERLEADQKEAARVSQLKDARIVALTAEVERVKQEASAEVWTLVGAFLAVAGALATAFISPRVGLPLILCAGLAGSFPHVYDSAWFEWVAGITLVLSCGLALWYMADKVSDAVRDKKDDATLFSDDAENSPAQSPQDDEPKA